MPIFTPAIYYPQAIQKPLLDHSIPSTISKKNLIVLHITQGQTAEGAIETFKGSKSPNRTSVHFVIDQDGTVYQLLSITDIGWHASEVNGRSVGIEHVAITPGTYSNLPKGLPVTEAQYKASSALVHWLGGKLGIPIDRQHVQGHNECSPADKHVQCCEPTLSVDRVVEMANALSTVLPT